MARLGGGGGGGELEGRVEVVLLLMAAMHDLPLPHHQEPGVTCGTHADHHHPWQADQRIR